jgi:hypothetical protein
VNIPEAPGLLYQATYTFGSCGDWGIIVPASCFVQEPATNNEHANARRWIFFMLVWKIVIAACYILFIEALIVLSI